ncbi:rRNA maturation RNase YbeY [Patescibacteria group bacterium]|nr:MAG: rRNA maturation RNase YbeY [Patescibacteria group bacterium]
MISIEVMNLTKQKIAEKDVMLTIKKIIKKLRQKKGFSFLKTVDLSIAFIGEGEMKKINKKYRKINKPTDELSFLLSKTKTKLSGEILLCPTIINQKNYSLLTTHYSLKLNYLLAHAFLHLCGFDHKTNKQYKVMEKIAKKLY